MNQLYPHFLSSRANAKAACGCCPWRGTAETRPSAVLSSTFPVLKRYRRLGRAGIASILFLTLIAAGCSRDIEASSTKEEITREPGVFEVDHPELFKLATVETRDLPTQVTANGTVNPDVNRTIHVTSMGSGRVVDLKVRLGDYVKKGQLLMMVSSPDLAGVMADYQKAKADEDLAHRALDRAQLLYDRGALAEKDLETAQNAESKAKVDVAAAEQHVRIIGGDPLHPSALIPLRAPVSGTIVEQNVAGFEGIKSLDNTPNLFTIADLTQVWVVCDVFENDLGEVHIGDAAEVRLNAFPDRIFHGRVDDISRVLDPNTRSAKVRIVLANGDGSLRPGMFATATFRSRKTQPQVVVPTTAVMRLHDKDWVFRKDGASRFRRMEVHAVGVTPDGFTQLQDGIDAGQRVVTNALEFSTAVAEQGK
jgi:cobalt-zinc-cadmium efflux system membrane fusion protein